MKRHIIFLAIVLLAAGCNNSVSSTMINKKNMDIQKMATTTANSTNAYLNWKTYQSSNYHFSLKYPENWYITNEIKNTGSEASGGGVVLSNQSTVPENELNKDQVVVNISAYKAWVTPGGFVLKDSKTNLLTWAQQRASSYSAGDSPTKSVAMELNLNGTKVVKITYDGNSTGNITGYYLEQGEDHYVQILVYANPGTSLDTAENIISTLVVNQ